MVMFVSKIFYKTTFEQVQLGKISIEKKRFLSGNLVLFFGRQNSRFESQFRTKNTIYTVYMQPKKQLKVQYIGIFEEIDSFYWPKMHF